MSHPLTITAQADTVSGHPPVAVPKDHREERHGATTVDPYHWLRDKQNPEVMAYLKAENEWTAQQTALLKPLEDKIYGEILGRIKQTDLDVPVTRGDFSYYSRTEEGKQYPIQCRRKGGTGPEEVILDLNQLASGRKFVGLGSTDVSDDGNLLAYTIDFSGYRQYDLHIKDLRSGQVLPDTAPRVTSVAWANDNRTLFMTTENEVTKRSDKLLRHHIGDSEFEEIYTERDELFHMDVSKTRDRSYLLLSIDSTDTVEQQILRADTPNQFFVPFVPRQKSHRYYLDHRAGLFYIRTNRNGAKDFAVMTAPDGGPQDPAAWQPWVPHLAGRLIEHVDMFDRFAVLLTKERALNQLRFFDFDKQSWSELSLPESVYALSADATPEFHSQSFRYRYQSFVTPPSIFDYAVQAKRSDLRKRQEVPNYDPTQYESERLWATARDGVQVPISIVHKKGLRKDGSAPLLLYGYGSYGIAIPPTFSASRFSLLDRGVSYAIAHIRGGDDLGEQWREDGMLMKKKNTFQDFVDCAQYLVDQKWTSSAKLLIEGGSAGGLLMGAVINMKPELFRAAHVAVPFVDVMNTMLDPTLPLTVGEYLEWGNPNEKAAYDYMKSYSPYDNLEKRAYPAMLVTSSLNDSQVGYWEPAKYVARLRTLKTDRTPLLLKMKMEPAGHGGASGRYDRIHDSAFEYAWMLEQVGIHQ